MVKKSFQISTFEKGSRLLEKITYLTLKKTSPNLFDRYEPAQEKPIKLPKLSIVLPNFNGQKLYLKNLFESIGKSSYPLNQLETILVDNGSTDNSVAYVKKYFPKVKIIKLDKNYGFARAVNIGVKKSTGAYLFITNNDVELEKNCLENLVKFLLSNTDVGIVGGKVLDYKSRSKISSCALAYNFALGSFIMSKNVNQTVLSDWIQGCSLTTSKKLWQKLSGFDEKFFFTSEEFDFCLRAKYLGFKTVYYPKATLWHVGGATINKPELQKFKYFQVYKSKLRLILKHGSLIEILLAFFFQFAIFLPFRNLILREKIAFPLLKAFIWNLKNMPKNLSSQRRNI